MNILIITRPFCWIKGHDINQDYSNFIYYSRLLYFLAKLDIYALISSTDRHKYDNHECIRCGKIWTYKQLPIDNW